MLTMFIRAAIIYTIVVITTRCMGKRQIAQLQPYELVVTIMIADLGSSPMEDATAPLLYGILPIAALVFMQSIFTLLTLKSGRLRNIINGQPSVLVRNGIVDEKELSRQAMTLSELLEEIRTAGFTNMNEVGCVVLEVSGDLSIYPTSQARPLTAEDMGIPTDYEGLPLPLILDGEIQGRLLEKGKLTRNWLENQLQPLSLQPKDIFLCVIDTKGDMSIQAKNSESMQVRNVLTPEEVQW